MSQNLELLAQVRRERFGYKDNWETECIFIEEECMEQQYPMPLDEPEKKPRKMHGGGFYFMLGTAIIRVQLDIGTGKVELSYKDEDDKSLEASWTVKKLKSNKGKEFLNKLGGIVMEMTNFDRTPLETFRMLRRKMISLLPKEQRPKDGED